MKIKLSLLILVSLAIAAATPAHTKDFYAGAFATPRSETPTLAAAAGQSGGGSHQVTLTWTASTSAAGCTSPCTFGYIVFRGTASGSENTQLNAVPATATTFVDSTVTLGSSPITYFYYVEAVETVGGVTVASGPSSEASATFPGIPAAPAGPVVATPK
jgi:hypothetical protein